MSAGKKYPLKEAMRAAWALRERLVTYCESGTCHIAGSVRREERQVGDLDIVALPDFAEVPADGDLFGAKQERDQLLYRLELLVRGGELVVPEGVTNAGDRMHRYVFVAPSGIDIPVQVFMVRPPAQLGVILAIRTGPAEYAKRMVANALRIGRRVKDGAVWPEGQWREGENGVVETWGTPIPCPREVDAFEACGWKWSDPPDRR